MPEDGVCVRMRFHARACACFFNATQKYFVLRFSGILLYIFYLENDRTLFGISFELTNKGSTLINPSETLDQTFFPFNLISPEFLGELILF